MSLVKSVRGVLGRYARMRTAAPAIAPAARSIASTARVYRAAVATHTPTAPVPNLPKALTDAPAHARKLLRWNFLEPDARAELGAYLVSTSDSAGATQPPAWFAETYEAARAYRTARARGWLPSDAALQRTGASSLDAYLDKETAALREQLAEGGVGRCTADELEQMDVQEQADTLLLPLWLQMSAEERESALTRVSFECVRKLGWRSGFSSGYPGTNKATPRPVATSAAWRALREEEEAHAWAAWQALSREERAVEWDTAWKQRDRSLVYVDDAPTTRVLGSVAPRWYAHPQRAGQLQFLPNLTVRLVRNYTPAGQAYDAWKATFRVPLNVHKHTLRSYLLAVYGLRTTWARSMIYRSRIIFNFQKKRRTPGRDRTFKKVEVGLLEPFVFPGLTKEFLRTHLFSQEMLYEERRMMLKMTKGRRWRGTKSVKALSKALDRNHAYQSAGAPDEAAGEKTAQLLTRSGSVPTARHGNILAVLSERRAERLARVQQYIDEQKAKK